MNKNKFELLNKLDRLDNNSNLSDIQGYIKDMMKINNFNNTPLELFCYLTEEIGELAKEIRKKENNMAIDLSKKYDSSL